MTLRDLKVSAFIAIRYFFSKKSTHAVNIIAVIAVAGIALVAAAMICVMSVFNGFEGFSETQLSSLSPDYKVVRVDGRPFSVDSLRPIITSEVADHVVMAPVLEARGMVSCGDNHAIVTLVGVDSTYMEVVDLSRYMYDGHFTLRDSLAPAAVIGIGVGAKLNTGADYIDPIVVMVPKRFGRLSLALPQRNFESRSLQVSGVFRVDQPDDGEVVYLSLDILRRLLAYTNECSAIDLHVLGDQELNVSRLQRALGADYRLEDRYMQHPDVFKVVKIEKWVSFALLLFVLLLSLFSVISTLGMLIIEKKGDSRTLSVLGARPSLVDQIIIFEGWILSITGLIIGLGVGLLLCYLQMRLGLIKLDANAGSVFLLESYPVTIVWSDLLIVVATILVIGWISSIIAYRLFKWNRD